MYVVLGGPFIYALATATIVSSRTLEVSFATGLGVVWPWVWP